MREPTSKENQKYDDRLKGTFYGVFIIGISILILWLSTFFVYTDRL